MGTIRKQGKSALIPHSSVKNTLPQPDINTAANMHHRCCYCIINNVAFEKENLNEAIKNWSFTSCHKQLIKKRRQKSSKWGTVSFQNKVRHKQKTKTLKVHSARFDISIIVGCQKTDSACIHTQNNPQHIQLEHIQLYKSNCGIGNVLFHLVYLTWVYLKKRKKFYF